MTARRKKPKAIIFAVFLIVLWCGAAWAAGISPGDKMPGQGSGSDAMLLVLYVLLALVFSFMCSVAEAVLLSVTPSFIASLEKSNPKKAALLKRLKVEDVDRSLAAILTLNTIAHTVGAIGSGSKATAVFGSAWFGVFSAVMTLMILFFSEIIPKTLGAVYWRRLSGVTATFVRWLTLALHPLIFISELLTRVIARGGEVHAFSRDEFAAMAGVGEEAGLLNEQESKVIRNLLRLQSLKAKDVMTPRTVITALPQDITVAQAMETQSKCPFSRIPLFEKDLDHATGFVLKDDMLLKMAQQKGDELLNNLVRELPIVSEDMPLSALLDFFLDKRRHIALIKDSFGGTKGLVTLEDVLETLLGMEIMDEMDKVKDMQALARQQWAKRVKSMGVEVDGVGNNQ